MISVRFQGKPFNIMVIQGYAPTSNTQEAEVERFTWGGIPGLAMHESNPFQYQFLAPNSSLSKLLVHTSEAII